jgi:hypothetical protein
MVLGRKSFIAFCIAWTAVAVAFFVSGAKADPGAECAKLLGKNEYEYRTCLAITRGTPNECASIQTETDRVRCRARAGASVNRR